MRVSSLILIAVVGSLVSAFGMQYYPLTTFTVAVVIGLSLIIIIGDKK